MPDINQYIVSHKELVELIIKSAGIHEGSWVLMVNFSLVGGNFSVAQDSAAPGAAVLLSGVGIQRVQQHEAPPASLVVDAATANPKKV
ncbi:MAG TPA: hypothetical protein PK694_04565 [Rhodospirillales bacterium]|jgi:hypothetical protein|nr:hypothetical protein [Rhodospirillales bacterium]